MSDRDPRTLAFVAIRDGEAWNDRRLPEMGRALNDALDRVSTLETALRPFAEKWDLHAAPYLNDMVDGEEARVLTARTVNEMIEDIKAARAALAEGDNRP